MSYSRWINSGFYTYWCSSKVYDKRGELFACHTSLDGQYMFTYTECTKFIENPEELRERITDQDLTDIELHELTLYMKSFINDVDHSYDQKMSEVRGGQ